MGKGIKMKGKKIEEQKKFKLLDNQAIEGKRTKIFLYKHKREGRFWREEKKTN
jgi:hypothetical protein